MTNNRKIIFEIFVKLSKKGPYIVFKTPRDCFLYNHKAILFLMFTEWNKSVSAARNY